MISGIPYPTIECLTCHAKITAISTLVGFQAVAVTLCRECRDTSRFRPEPEWLKKVNLRKQR